MSVSKHLVFAYNILFISLTLINHFFVLPSFWNLLYFFYILLLIDTIFFVYYIKKLEENNIYHEFGDIFKYLFFLVLLVIGLTPFLGNSQNPFFMHYLAALSIDLGFLTIYTQKRDLNNHLKERVFSFQVKDIFVFNHEGILKRFIHREGFFHSITLLFIILGGFTIRLWNLSFLDPFRDELIHLVAAKRFFIEGFFFYDRSQELTYLVALFFKLFNSSSVFIGRFPIVLIGTGSIILIYILGKKLNSTIGLIAAFLLAFSPWAIGMSRFVREYELNSFFLLILLIFLTNSFIHFEKWITHNKRLRWSFFLQSGISLLLLNYLYYHYNPTAKLVIFIAGVYSITYCLMLLATLIDFKTNNRFYLERVIKIFLFFILLISLYYLTRGIAPPLLSDSSFHEPRYFNVLFSTDNFSNYIHLFQWFEQIKVPTFFFIVLMFFPFTLYTNRIQFSLASSFITFLFFMMYLSQRYFQERYLYYINPIYILLFSISLYVLFSLSKFNLSISKNQLVGGVLVFLSIFFIFNPFIGINLTINEPKTGFDYKTGIVHYDVDSMISKLDSLNFTTNHSLITSNFGEFAFIYNYSFYPELANFSYIDPMHQYILAYDYPKNVEFYIYDLENETARLNEVIHQTPTGFIVVDKYRNRLWVRGWSPYDQTIFDKRVTYHGEFGEFDVFSWKPIQ